MNGDKIFEWAFGLGFVSWLIGIPIAAGYLIALPGAKESIGLVMFGSVLWPLVLLGRIGWLLAS